MLPHPRHALRALPLFAFAIAGCKDVESFSTSPGESYCGSVVQGKFVRTGLGPDVQVRMTFDATQVTGSPGLVTTSDGLLKDAPLHSVPTMFADPVSMLQFGEGRRKNYLFAAEPPDPSLGQRVNVVVSLMETGEAEVRLIRWSPNEWAGAPGGQRPPVVGGTPGDVQIFGVFPVTRQRGTCGF